MISIPLLSIITFAVVLISIGVYYRHQKQPEEYYMAGRGSGVLRILASTFTLVGAGEVVTLTAFSYLYGLSGTSLFLGYLVGAFVLAALMARIRYDIHSYSPYSVSDFLRQFLGFRSEKVSIVLSLVGAGSLFVIQLVVGALLLTTLTTLTYTTAVITMGIVIVLYLILGGFNSVLSTDVLQAVAMFILVVLVALLYNPAGSLAETIQQTEHLIPPIDFVSLLTVGLLAAIGSPDIYQRLYASRSNEVAKSGVRWAGVAIFIFGLLVIALGLQIATQYPDANPNNAFFAFLEGSLSTGLMSVLAMFIVASIFSTADTELFLSSILVGKLFKGEESEMNSRTGQLLVGFIAIVGVVIAFFSKALVDIYFVVIYAFMAIGVVMVARLFNRGTDSLAAVGMSMSLIILILLISLGKLGGLYPLLIAVPPLITLFKPASTKIMPA